MHTHTHLDSRYTCTYIHIHTHIHIRIRIYLHTHRHRHIHIHIDIHIHIHINLLWCLHITYILLHTHKIIYTHAYTHVYIYTYIHYIHISAHIHIHDTQLRLEMSEALWMLRAHQFRPNRFSSQIWGIFRLKSVFARLRVPSSKPLFNFQLHWIEWCWYLWLLTGFDDQCSPLKFLFKT